jgi:Flp pilus assembly protein TadD
MRILPLLMLGALAGPQIARAQAEPADVLKQTIADANAAVQAGQFDTAIAKFQGALDSLEADSPAAGDLYLRLGETYRRKGDMEAAIRTLARANDLVPGNATIVGTLALALDSNGNRTEARRAYRATLDLDPDNAIAMNNLAFLLAESESDLDEALQLAERAMALMPDAIEIADTAGWVHLKRGETAAAIALFARAVSKEPNDEGFRDHLLLALERKGDRAGVSGDAISALKQIPSPENLSKLTTLVQGLK